MSEGKIDRAGDDEMIEAKTMSAHHYPPPVIPQRKRAAKKAASANPRRGRVVEGADGAAKFAAGAAPAKPAVDAMGILERLRLYWSKCKGESGHYYIYNEHEEGWSAWTQSDIKIKILAVYPFCATRPRQGESISDMERVLLLTREQRYVHAVYPRLAGYKPGVHRVAGMNILVLEKGTEVLPVQGDPAPVLELVESRLGEHQSMLFHAWMARGYRSLLMSAPGKFKPGHCLILAGPANACKSLLQNNIITGMLGRNGDPETYMFGLTRFNSELAEATHLQMEDPAASQVTVDRVKFGENIKKAVANKGQRVEPKFGNAARVVPFWRLSLSLNDDPDKLRILPLMTDDLTDKLLFFRVKGVSESPLPQPNGTEDEQEEYDRLITAALPAYGWWLLHEFAPPPEFLRGRFGCPAYADDQLMESINEDTPHEQLLRLLDLAEFREADDRGKPLPEAPPLKLWQLPPGTDNWESKIPGLWWGPTPLLENLLCGNQPGWSCSVAIQARKLCTHSNALQTLLKRLRKDHSLRVDSEKNRRRSGDQRDMHGWRVSRPLED